MSEASPTSQTGGKVLRPRKRRSSSTQSLPYKKPDRTSAMPTTRHSPARSAAASQPPLPTDPVLRELTLLRQAMEVRFTESAARVDNLREELVAKHEDNDQAVSELQLAVTDVTLSVDRNERAIQEVRAEVERREVELPQKVKTIVQEALAKATATGRGPTSGTGVRPRPIVRIEDLEEAEDTPSSISSAKTDKKMEAYELARHSLRLWPVSREGNLKDRTIEFLVNELLIDQQQASNLVFEVKRVGTLRSKERSDTQIKDEVLLHFSSVRDRDDVRTFARNLERKGRGLRLEVPDHLWPSFRALQDVAFELKKKNRALKRNILFDDAVHNLKMDICLDSTEWKTIYPDGARASLAKIRPASTGRAQISPAELDDLLAPAPEAPMEEA